MSTCEVQIATKIVNFGESPIVAVRACQRLSLSQASERFVDPGNQAVGRGATEKRAAPARISAGHCQSLEVGSESLGAAPCVQLQIARKHCEFECIGCPGRESEAACGKRDRLVAAEDAQPRLCLTVMF